jgi:uncharacterized phage protein (TIGR01671 family)
MSQHPVIKFRAWDHLLKRFNDHYARYIYEAQKLDFIELNQFTGLLDVNGTEIYGNDFLKDDRNIYLIKWSEKEAGFRVDRKGWIHDHFVTEMNGLKDCEVIGNVYENIDLLNGT